MEADEFVKNLVIIVVFFYIGLYTGSTICPEKAEEPQLLCKQSKELQQKNNVILTCVENK
jgi:hypothetical protein